MKFLKIILILVFTLRIQISYCQNFKDTILINEVSVTAPKKITDICLNYNRIDTVILKNNISSNLSELLSNNTSVFIKNYGNSSISTASFRGTASSHTQVLWNGININSPSSGQVDFSQIPVFLIDDVEIYYGSSSLSQTVGALGGSISLENTPDFTEKFKFKTLINYGSFHSFKTLNDLSLGNSNIQLRTRIYFEKSENNFLFVNNAIPNEEIQYQENAEFEKKGILQELNYKISSKSIISLNIWKQLTNRNIPQIMSFGGFHRTEYQNDDDLKLFLNFKKTSKKIVFKIKSSYSTNKLEYYLGDSIFVYNGKNLFFEKANSKSLSNSFSNNISMNYKFSESFEIVTKYNINFYTISTSDFFKSNKEKISSKRIENILFAGIYNKISKKITAYLVSNTLIENKKIIPLIPAFGIDFKPVSTKDLHLKSNISKNYHLPSLNDLYWKPGGNPNLLQEEGYSGDFTFSYSETYKNHILSFEASVFSSLIENWIVWQPSEFQYWTAQNLRKVFSSGIESNFKLKGKIMQLNYQIFLNYSYTSTKNIVNSEKLNSSGNRQLIYIPKNLFHTFISFEKDNFEINFSYSYTDKRFTSFSNKNILPANSLIDLSFSKTINFSKFTTELQFSIKNVLNSQYQCVLFRAMPGRNYNFLLLFLIN